MRFYKIVFGSTGTDFILPINYLFKWGILWRVHSLRKLKTTHSKNAGLFHPNLGKLWTNPNVGLKNLFKILTQLQLSLSTF